MSYSIIPTGIKYAEATPIHKKDAKLTKKLSPILPNLSKVHERLMYNQIYLCFYTIFSKFQCGFQKGFDAQHCLLAMVENNAKP